MAARLTTTVPKSEVLVRFSDPDTGPVEWRFPLVKVEFRPDIEDGLSWRDGVCSYKDADRLVGMHIEGYAKAPENGAVAGWMLRRNVDDLVTELAAAVHARRPIKMWRALRAIVDDGYMLLASREAMIR